MSPTVGRGGVWGRLTEQMWVRDAPLVCLLCSLCGGCINARPVSSRPPGRRQASLCSLQTMPAVPHRSSRVCGAPCPKDKGLVFAGQRTVCSPTAAVVTAAVPSIDPAVAARPCVQAAPQESRPRPVGLRHGLRAARLPHQPAGCRLRAGLRDRRYARHRSHGHRVDMHGRGPGGCQPPHGSQVGRRLSSLRPGRCLWPSVTLSNAPPVDAWGFPGPPTASLTLLLLPGRAHVRYMRLVCPRIAVLHDTLHDPC